MIVCDSFVVWFWWIVIRRKKEWKNERMGARKNGRRANHLSTSHNHYLFEVDWEILSMMIPYTKYFHLPSFSNLRQSLSFLCFLSFSLSYASSLPLFLPRQFSICVWCAQVLLPDSNDTFTVWQREERSHSRTLFVIHSLTLSLSLLIEGEINETREERNKEERKRIHGPRCDGPEVCHHR